MWKLYEEGGTTMKNFQWFYGLCAGILTTVIIYGEIGLHWVLLIPIPLGIELGYLMGERR